MKPFLDGLLYLSCAIICGLLCAGYYWFMTAVLSAIWKGEIR